MHRFLVLGLAVTSLCSMSAQAPRRGGLSTGTSCRSKFSSDTAPS